MPRAREEVRRFQVRSGIACVTAIPDNLPDLPAEKATALYRICQESLTNVARHAGASQVQVSLRTEGGVIVLRVEDDGRGIDQGASRPRALGLLGMRERITAVGGDLAIESAPGRGTAVVASLPMTAGGRAEPGGGP